MFKQNILSARQQLFVTEYLVDGNGQRAAIAAGYGVAGAAVAAHRLLSNANVRAVLVKRQHAHAARLSLKREDVAAAFLEAAQLARAQRNPMALIASARALGKLFGFYAPQRVNVAAEPTDVMSRLNCMSTAQLVTVIDEGPAAAGQ